MNLIFFDLEGPLAAQDNAYELMKLFPFGAARFSKPSAGMMIC
jgi:predicted HAD superfamily phosphohydrolase